MQQRHRHTHTHKEGSHVKMKAEIRAMLSQSKQYWELSANQKSGEMQGDKLYFDIKQKLKIIKTIQYQFLKKRERERHGVDSFLHSSERQTAQPTLWFWTSCIQKYDRTAAVLAHSSSWHLCFGSPRILIQGIYRKELEWV